MGATQAQLAEQLDAFRDHARAHARKQADWDSAFKNWLRKAKEFGTLGRGSNRRSPYYPPDDGMVRG
jgi:hypothetical protein